MVVYGYSKHTFDISLAKERLSTLGSQIWRRYWHMIVILNVDSVFFFNLRPNVHCKYIANSTLISSFWSNSTYDILLVFRSLYLVSIIMCSSKFLWSFLKQSAIMQLNGCQSVSLQTALHVMAK